MSGISRLRHVAAMNPPGRGSISTEEAREVLARVTTLDEVADALDRWLVSDPNDAADCYDTMIRALYASGRGRWQHPRTETRDATVTALLAAAETETGEAVGTCPNPVPCGRPDVCRYTCGPVPAAETGICPVPCDDDCEAPCHEAHAVPWKREHDPKDCPAAKTGSETGSGEA